jgi:tRNA threonylcarbamoyladenosine biosynthesis protein TsaE
MPILDVNSLEIFSRSPEQTRRVGMRLGAFLQTGDVICLQGELGAGKTTFVQGIAQGWGSLDPVSSPTFVLVNTYRRSDEEMLFHLDTYRLTSDQEAEELDLEEMTNKGPLVIEWPERVKTLLPPHYLWVLLSYQDEEVRSMVLTPHGDRFRHMISELRQSVFGVV